MRSGAGRGFANAPSIRRWGLGLRIVASASFWTGGGHLERVGRYPKDGDLCVARTKPGETLVEVRSDSDVQIDRQSCA